MRREPDMSGGPVFNNSGEVIGLVSRSLAGTEKGLLRIAWTTCFQLVPSFRILFPTVDLLNPYGRWGWAVVRQAPWHLADFCETQKEGLDALNKAGEGYDLILGSNRTGTDDFVAQSG
jgi:serine protease Do